MKLINFLMIILFLWSSTLYSSSIKRKNWLDTLPEAVDIHELVKSFKFEPELKLCKINNINDSLVGAELHHMDLFVFTETVREKGWVICMGTNVLTSKKNEDDDKALAVLEKILGFGNNRSKSGKHYVNMIHIPVIASLSEALGIDGMACFHPENKTFFYASSIDPTAVDYMQYFILLDTVSMFTINGIMAMVIDCASYTGFDGLSDKNSQSAQYFSKIIDSYQHSYGCSGGVTLGASNQSQSPLVNGLTTSATLIKILSRSGKIMMQTRRSLLNEGRDVTCNQLSGPMIKTQYAPQMLLPVVSGVFELGVTPAKWAEFKDDQMTRGNTAIGWWVRKDYTSFSGSCTW